MLTALTSSLLGIAIGIIYASSFIRGETRSFLGVMLAPFVRITIFGSVLYLLLLSHTIHFIIFMLMFLTTWWLLILKQKVRFHDRNQSL